MLSYETLVLTEMLEEQARADIEQGQPNREEIMSLSQEDNLDYDPATELEKLKQEDKMDNQILKVIREAFEDVKISLEPFVDDKGFIGLRDRYTKMEVYGIQKVICKRHPEDVDMQKSILEFTIITDPRLPHGFLQDHRGRGEMLERIMDSIKPGHTIVQPFPIDDNYTSTKQS